jgi:hypothetical protein
MDEVSGSVTPRSVPATLDVKPDKRVIHRLRWCQPRTIRKRNTQDASDQHDDILRVIRQGCVYTGVGNVVSGGRRSAWCDQAVVGEIQLNVSGSEHMFSDHRT